MDLQQRVLRTDVSGMPLEWVGYQEAVRLITLGQVSYSLGKTLYHIHGGINALNGCQSVVSVDAIIATQGQHPHKHLSLLRPAVSKLPSVQGSRPPAEPGRTGPLG